MRPWIAAVALLATACSTFSSFDPEPMETIPFMERAKTQTRGDLTITAAVMSRDEARRAFGIDLESLRIQPVYFEIENRSAIPYSFMMTGVDPNYFSAREVSYKSHFTWRPGTNRKMDAHFHAHDLEPYVPPHGGTKGFLFTNLKLGTKEVRVRLFGPKRVEEFEFYISVPGFRADYHEVDWDTLDAREFTDYTDEESFREVLRNLPCCTTRKDGTGEGDPVNLVIIGSGDKVAAALTRSGWDETELLTTASAWRTFKAFFGGEYKYSPMSALYLFGRPQDAGFQKARQTIHERNHLRLWYSDIRFRGEEVWIGTITRDIGVYFTTRAWNLTTHAIDPMVDEARDYLSEDFITSRSVARYGFVKGVGPASPEDPHRNLMNAPWWTNGLRLVMELSKEHVPMDEVEFFYWDWGVGDDEFLNMELRRAIEAGGR